MGYTAWIYFTPLDYTLKNDLDGVHWKQMRNLKLENYVLFSVLAEYLSLQVSLSDSSEGLFQRGKEWARIHRNVCKKKKIEQKIIVKDILS